MPKFSKGNNLKSVFGFLFLKVNQVIYLQSPITLLSFNIIAQMVSEISNKISLHFVHRGITQNKDITLMRNRYVKFQEKKQQ